MARSNIFGFGCIGLNTRNKKQREVFFLKDLNISGMLILTISQSHGWSFMQNKRSWRGLMETGVASLLLFPVMIFPVCPHHEDCCPQMCVPSFS